MKQKVFVAVLRYILVLFVSITVILTTGCGDENSVLQTQRGSISGIVSDTNKLAIKGAIITSNRSLFKAETDEMGRYMFTSLDSGHHHLTVERDGYFLGSATVELAYGQTLDNVNITVERLEKMITTSIAVKEKTSVVLDINCHEPMSVSVTYREMTNMPSTTEPTKEMITHHRIVLDNLYSGADYYYSVTGKTSDGRTFTTDLTNFKTLYMYDIPGAPATPENLIIKQTYYGPELSWKYNGSDPIKGFRIYRSENGGKSILFRDESEIFDSQTSLVDDCVFAGRYYTYQVYSVDYEGNLSEIPAEKSFMPTGAISENLVWKKSWSPISIEGDITVPSRYTLTIEPGTSIRFSSNSNNQSSLRTDVCEFIVEGTLIAVGTESDPIKFLSQSSIPTKNDWDGIRFLASADQERSQISHVIVSGAEKGLEVYENNIDINNYSARYCKTGLSVLTASGTVINNIFIEDCDIGFKAEGSFYTSIYNLNTTGCGTGAVFNNNSNISMFGFNILNCKNYGILTVDRNNTLLRNGIVNSFEKGISIGGDSCDAQFLTINAVYGVLLEGALDAKVENNIIVNLISKGTGIGIEDMSASGKSYPYNNIFGFNVATVNCTQSGASIYNVDPVFVGNNGNSFDYHLMKESPLLTVSSVKGEIGAYGNRN